MAVLSHNVTSGDLRNGLGILRVLLPFTRRHRRPFVLGCLAACGVVAGRLALPWPLRAITDRWDSGGGADGGPLTGLLPDTSDYVLAMGAIFLAVILLLGLFDFLERLQFAKFSIGTVRKMRSKAFWAALGIRNDGRLENCGVEDVVNSEDGENGDEEERLAGNSGDLVARLVGDTARIKSGLQGFLVHVMTNGIMFLGVTVVLFVMDFYLGLIFAAAGIGTAVVTGWAAGRMFHCSLKHRTKEGRLAEQIQEAFSRDPSDAKFVKINKSSGKSEATQKRIEGIATWGAHILFGLAVLGALLVGTQAAEAGRLALGDIVVIMMYALLMRGPIVRLARQGSRTGKTMGAADRLAQILRAARPEADAPPPVRLLPLRRHLRLVALTEDEGGAGEGMPHLGPIDVKIPAGQKVAILGQAGAGKTALLELICGVRTANPGKIFWDDASIGAMPAKRRARQIAYVPRDANDDPSAITIEQRLLDFIALIYRNPSVWLFDDPSWHLPKEASDDLVAALLDTRGRTTVVVASDRPIGIERFDRVLHMDEGHIVFDGLPEEWRNFTRGERASLAGSQEAPRLFGEFASQTQTSSAAEAMVRHPKARHARG